MAEVAIAGNLFGDILRGSRNCGRRFATRSMKASKRQEFGIVSLGVV
jgi:hypothetical protein